MLFPPPLPLAVKNDVGSEICFFCRLLFFELRLWGKFALGADADVDGGVAEDPVDGAEIVYKLVILIFNVFTFHLCAPCRVY